MIAELHEELEQITEMIASLERLAGGQPKRRGRPPKWLSEIKRAASAEAKRRGRPRGSKDRKTAAKR